MIKGRHESGYGYDAEVRRVLPGVEKFSREEENRLGLRILDGDEEAIGELAIKNMPFAIREANKYARAYGIPPRDLYQEVFEKGLMKAAGKYDTRRGYRFLTYAQYWVEQALRRYVKKLKRDTDAGADSLFEEVGFGDEPDAREMIDTIPNENSPDAECLMEIAELRERVRAMITMAHLSPTELRVISWRFGLYEKKQRDYKEIAEKLDISKSEVKEIERKVLRRIRGVMGG